MLTNVYIDGFNLYYGSVKDTPYRWLDLEALFDRLRPDDEIQEIKYFTAKVRGDSGRRQATYLKALETLTRVHIVLGRFKNKEAFCRVQNCSHKGSRKFIVPEEKRTDVNIAIALLDDAYQHHAEQFVVVSGDSDLVPAIDMAKMRFPKIKIIVYVPTKNPTRGAAVELRSSADKARELPMKLVQRSQFPKRVPDGAGGFLEKPEIW